MEPSWAPDLILTFTSRDLATILFALRYLQANRDDTRSLEQGGEHFIGHTPLTNREIDYLCQYLNTKSIVMDGQELDVCLKLAQKALEFEEADDSVWTTNRFVSMSDVIGGLNAQDLNALQGKLNDINYPPSDEERDETR